MASQTTPASEADDIVTRARRQQPVDSPLRSQRRRPRQPAWGIT